MIRMHRIIHLKTRYTLPACLYLPRVQTYAFKALESSDTQKVRWMKFDPNALLATIGVPTLVVKGDRSVRLVAEDDWFTRSGMSNYVRFKVIPQMGHRLKEADFETDITRSDRNRTMSLHPDLIITITTYIANI